MGRYLIELPHVDDGDGCVRALHALATSGSHFVTHAEWGCMDGCHCGWFIVETESRDAAKQIVPPEFRHEARIIELNRFSREQIAAWMKQLGDRPA